MATLTTSTPTHFANPGFLVRKLSTPLPQARVVAFETALSLTGFGKFQWCLVVVCGLVYLSAGYQNGLTAYVIPAAKCDLSITSEQKGLLNAVFLVGGLASAFLWGILADQTGRRPVLVYSMLADAAITAISSTSQSFNFFVAFRFINGFLIGAPSSIVCTYLGEFIGVRQRARCLICMGSFFTLSWLLLPLVAMAILPGTWQVGTNGFVFNSWRLFVLVGSVPTTTAGLLLLCFFPESPKFLYSRGDEMAAVKVLREMYLKNYGQNANYPVDGILAVSTEGSRSRRSVILDPLHTTSSAGGKSVSRMIGGAWGQAVSILTPPIASATALSAALIFCNMFALYGFGLWLPELFDRFSHHYSVSNRSVSVCEVSMSQASNSTGDVSCDARSTPHHTVYVNTLITGAVCLAFNIFCSLSANRYGLNVLSVVTSLMCGLCVVAIYFVHTSIDYLIVSCFLLGFGAAANSVVTSAICDLFPTRVRGLAVCAAMFAGRTGAVLSNLTLGYLLDTFCQLPVFLMAAVLLLGAGLSMLLPGKNTRQCVPVAAST